MDGGRGDGRNKVRQRGREAPLIGRWHGGTLQLPWGYMNPGAAFSLSLSPPPLFSLSLSLPLPLLSISLSLSLSASLTLPPSFLYSLPSLRFYPTAKRRRVTWTQKRSIRASPTRPRSLSYSPLFYPSFTSISLYHPSTRLAILGQSFISRYSPESFRTKTSESEKNSVIVVRC